VIGNHLSGNLASSTFRLTLAALLMQTLQLHPERRTKKIVLSASENALLSTWQERNLRLCWRVTDRPWDIERRVIETMAPPLNLAANRSHPFHVALSASRRALRTGAVPRPPHPEV
jgi:hypothetical protein